MSLDLKRGEMSATHRSLDSKNTSTASMEKGAQSSPTSSPSSMIDTFPLATSMEKGGVKFRLASNRSGVRPAFPQILTSQLFFLPAYIYQRSSSKQRFNLYFLSGCLRGRFRDAISCDRHLITYVNGFRPSILSQVHCIPTFDIFWA